MTDVPAEMRGACRCSLSVHVGDENAEIFESCLGFKDGCASLDMERLYPCPMPLAELDRARHGERDRPIGKRSVPGRLARALSLMRVSDCSDGPGNFWDGGDVVSQLMPDGSRKKAAFDAFVTNALSGFRRSELAECSAWLSGLVSVPDRGIVESVRALLTACDGCSCAATWKARRWGASRAAEAPDGGVSVIARRSDGTYSSELVTIWEPPLPFFETLSRCCPRASFTLSFSCPDAGVSGRAEIIEGESSLNFGGTPTPPA